jgi:hypothetical protein
VQKFPELSFPHLPLLDFTQNTLLSDVKSYVIPERSVPTGTVSYLIRSEVLNPKSAVTVDSSNKLYHIVILFLSVHGSDDTIFININTNIIFTIVDFRYFIFNSIYLL